jgi:hypothetical protein
MLKDLRDTDPAARATIDAVNDRFRWCTLQGAQGDQETDQARRGAAGGLTPANSLRSSLLRAPV